MIVLAEASPCCPSPIVGNIFAAIYIVIGVVAYVWLAAMIRTWLRSRR